MAQIMRRGAGKPFTIRFRFETKSGNELRFNRSLETTEKKEAESEKAKIEKTIRLLKEGVLTLPEGATPDEAWTFFRSGGKITSLPKLADTIPLADVIKDYFETSPEGSKEKSSLTTEKIHGDHFQRLLKASTPISSIGKAELEKYIVSRQKEDGIRGRKVSPETVKKELQTFRQIWQHAEGRGWVSGKNPAGDVRRPQSSEKLPFMTYEDIAKKVLRIEDDHEKEDLWSCLFLDETEISSMLKHVEAYAADHPEDAFVFPMLAFVAYTGCRRSEMMRSEIDDIDMDRGMVRLREKKRSRTKSLTYREVELHRKLRSILVAWFARHPGGKHTICQMTGSPLTPKETDGGIKRALRKSKWAVIEGYHVLRHSFASNCAKGGISPSIIDAWMGHTTEEMRKRYRHLFPAETKRAMDLLFVG